MKHGLTPRGREQALSLAERFRGIPVRKLFSSPLLRAVQTAQVLSYAFEVPYETTEALREFDCGVLEGKSDEASWAIFSEVFGDWINEGNWERRIEGGESFLEIQARFLPFVKRLVEAYGHTSINIILVGHGGTYLCMLPLVLENIDFEFVAKHHLDNTGYVLAEVEEGRLRCLEWNNAPV
jgi:broad specificity phosphatase PhoE